MGKLTFEQAEILADHATRPWGLSKKVNPAIKQVKSPDFLVRTEEVKRMESAVLEAVQKARAEK